MTPSIRPADRQQPSPRDREFERRINHGYERLVADFVAQGFKTKEARLWVAAWRHQDNPALLARYALVFHHLRVEAQRAVPWYWAKIRPAIAVGYLAYGWVSIGADRVARALQHQDASLNRREALRLGLRWAETYWTSAESEELISMGYDLETANQVSRHLEREAAAHAMAGLDSPSTIQEWSAAGVPPLWVRRYLAAGLVRVEEASEFEPQRHNDPDDLAERLRLLALLSGGIPPAP